MKRQTKWPFGWECGCNMESGYCDKHERMMRLIYNAYYGDDDKLAVRIYAQSDGYGPVGHIPPQGYDYSGIRDSSPEAIERMWRIAQG